MVRRLEAAGVRWWLSRDADAESLPDALARILDALDRGALVDEKSGRRKALYRVALRADGPVDALLKVNRYRPLAGLRRALRPSKSRHELQMAEAAARRGIPTPLPLAAGERRAARRLHACFLLVPLVPGAVDLRRVWGGGSLPPAERHRLIAAFGGLSRRVQDAGLFQEDFAPNNFLVRRGASPELWVVDFERARLRRANSPRARRFMLAKIDREMVGATASDRMRFLRAYCGDDQRAARDWWARVRAFAPRLARRDFRRLARNARRESRRFRTLADGEWRGLARRQAALPQLVAARAAAGAQRRPFGVDARGHLWRVSYPQADRREALRLWTLARLLAARGISPAPAGVWWRASEVVLLLERARDATPLAAHGRPPEARRGLRVLLDRALTLAELEGSLGLEAFVASRAADGRLCVALVAPHALRIAGRATPATRARSAALTAQLLA